jgi:hypothetical protein
MSSNPSEELKKELSDGYCPNCECKSIYLKRIEYPCHYRDYSGFGSNCAGCTEGPCTGYSINYQCSNCGFLQFIEGKNPPY